MKKANKVTIYSFKHNGSFHRLWENSIVIEETPDYIVAGNLRAKVTEGDGRIWEAREPAITIFFTKKWYNVICMLRDTGIHYYSNIASPAFPINDEITYIDYDLDVGLSPDNNIRILDEGEYHRHQEEMHYSLELDYVLKEALYEVLDNCKKRVFPFVDEKVHEFYQKFIELNKNKEGE